MASPGGGETQSEAKGGRLGAGGCGTKLVEWPRRHLSKEGIESSPIYGGGRERGEREGDVGSAPLSLTASPFDSSPVNGGARGGWTRTHVLYMF